jgi:hypothetical protein
MAAPNIVNVTTIRGNTAVLNVSTVTANIVVNPVSSNKVYKINTLMLSNIDGNVAVDGTASIQRGGIDYQLVSTATIPADATLIVITKDNMIYVEEGDSIRLTASANLRLQAVCSYEEIS